MPRNIVRDTAHLFGNGAAAKCERIPEPKQCNFNKYRKTANFLCFKKAFSQLNVCHYHANGCNAASFYRQFKIRDMMIKQGRLPRKMCRHKIM